MFPFQEIQSKLGSSAPVLVAVFAGPSIFFSYFPNELWRIKPLGQKQKKLKKDRDLHHVLRQRLRHSHHRRQTSDVEEVIGNESFKKEKRSLYVFSDDLPKSKVFLCNTVPPLSPNATPVLFSTWVQRTDWDSFIFHINSQSA